MITRVCGCSVAILLGGCATANSLPPEKPAPQAATATAPAAVAAQSSPLAGVVPADPLEADLLAHPEDLRGLADRAVLLYHQAAVAATPGESRQIRRKARAFALAAVQGGSRDLFMPVMAGGISEDGSELKTQHSSNPDADRLVEAGEHKFARGDLSGALVDYRAAWKLDPSSSRIALFIGDVYFGNKEHLTAIEWFDRAIALAPFGETAHRYRADALMRLRRVDEARDGYIFAVISDPYGPLPRGMLQRWAGQTGRPLLQPDVSFPTGSFSVKDGKFQLNVTQENDALSLGYLVMRAAYCEEQHQNPANYRHSLAEEVHGLRMLLQTAAELRGSPESAAEVNAHKEPLNFLQSLLDRDLLEAHVLLDRADPGIAQDYLAYRAGHADRLRRYIQEVWLGQKSG